MRSLPTSYPVGLCVPKPPGCAILSFHVPHRLCLVNAASILHPAVAAWFERQFHAPTAAQAQAWPAIRAGEHVLVAAPTGSGKTLAAFLAAIDSLVRQGLEGRLEDATQIVYVSPLKALSNDIEKNWRLRLPVSARPCAPKVCPTSKSAHWCERAIRRRANATRCAAGRPISSSPRRNHFTSC